MKAAKRLFPRMHTTTLRHLATIPLLNVLMDNPIWTIFAMTVDIDNKNQIAFTKSSKKMHA